jgi:autotransporter adhesin
MASRGVAIATALASVPALDGDKKFGIGFGTGTYDGRVAFSFALIARAGDNAQFRVNAGTAGNGKIAAGAGATFGF